MSYFMEGFPVLFMMAANSFLVLSVSLLIYFFKRSGVVLLVFLQYQ